jgi:hypothetical protein
MCRTADTLVYMPDHVVCATLSNQTCCPEAVNVAALRDVTSE